MTTKLNHIKSALRESIEIASKATEGPWAAFQACGSICVGDSREVTCIQDLDKGLHLEILGGDAEANAAFVSHARTMTPLACKALLLAIERLELGLKCQEANEGLWAFSFNTLESITSTWPDA